MGRVTIRDIADRAGVSVATVSLVLNGKENRIAKETKKKVISIANELGYQPNRLAVGLMARRTNTIGLILPDISNAFFGEMAKGAEGKAAENDFYITICNTNDIASRDYDYLNILLDRGVDGIILVPSSRGMDGIMSRCFALLEQCQKPFVLADRIRVSDKYSSVTLDQEAGGFLATDHLIQNGHRKIGCITGPLGMPSAYLRYQGYRKALKATGIAYRPQWVQEGNYHMEDVMEFTKKLLQEGVTAIFACNDMMAYGLYRTAVDARINVPEQLSIVGFDDILFSQFLEVPMTTIHQPVYQMGETAVEKVLALIKNKDEKNERIVFKPELIIRSSVKKIGGLRHEPVD